VCTSPVGLPSSSYKLNLYPCILKKLLQLLFLLCFSVAAHAQSTQVSGTVMDSTGITIPGINIKMVAGKDSTTVSTDANGKYSFPSALAKSFKLEATGIGYDPFRHDYTINTNGTPVVLPVIKLTTQVNELNTVNITAIKNPITIKQDTVEYNAQSYKVREGSVVEDILKKLPGVGVDKDGNVEAHGKPITKVRVNGKDYFRGDVQTATQNLPADIIENIQVIDDYGDQANLTGIKTGEPDKILNITIQKNKRTGLFGQSTLGAGTDKRYLGRLSANTFKNERQLSFIANINNTNGNAFNFGGGGNFGGRGGGRGGGGGTPAASPTGITKSRSGGFNYRDELSKKVTIYSSYSFSGRDRNANTISRQQELYLTDTVLTDNK
ncbi:MAG: carboxypeptidase regulatory-like domain-containing protein, partial [Sphingobacteriaceae bacterium]